MNVNGFRPMKKQRNIDMDNDDKSVLGIMILLFILLMANINF